MRPRVVAAIALAAAATVLAWCLRQVCVPISPAELLEFNVPIDRRTDRDFYLRVFQYRDGQWHQCKTWLSRQLFF